MCCFYILVLATEHRCVVQYEKIIETEGSDVPNKAFLEITNACNLSCGFCHGTKRPLRYMSKDEFTTAAKKLCGWADYLYFHVMGEPLLHPDLAGLLDVADELGHRVILTTNGTLLSRRRDTLLSASALHKVSVSCHCYEVNSLGITLDEYLTDVFDFCRRAADAGIIAVMRLWNLGGKDSLNERILTAMHAAFPGEWKQIYSGYKLCDRVFLEWGEKFDWPDEKAEPVGADHSCYGLRDQIGILSDGTVVPCCLDADGAVPLGNIFESDLDAILTSPRAVALRRSFECGHVTEELCRRCGYAASRMKR